MKHSWHTSVARKVFWQALTVIGILILFASPLTATAKALGNTVGLHIPIPVTAVEAKEIFSMFTCPCCSQPLDEDAPCCDDAREMIDFIHKQTDSGVSRDAVVLAAARQFGLERLASETDRAAVRQEMIATAPKDAPELTAAETRRDLGIVHQTDGTVTTGFTFKNEGKSDLVISSIDSSCGCTSGSITYKGNEGPRFYMPGHDFPVPDPNWKVSIAPGDTATVKMYYDPAFHKDLVGPVTRTVTVYSSDPVDAETTFTITLDQEK